MRCAWPQWLRWHREQDASCVRSHGADCLYQPQRGETAGSLYKEQRGLSLIADTRARSVGDIIIVLVESTGLEEMRARRLRVTPALT